MPIVVPAKRKKQIVSPNSCATASPITPAADCRSDSRTGPLALALSLSLTQLLKHSFHGQRLDWKRREKFLCFFNLEHWLGAIGGEKTCVWVFRNAGLR